MVESSATKLAQVKLATKADIFDLIKKTDFDVKLKKMIKKSSLKYSNTSRGWKETNWPNKKSCTNIRKKIWFFVG